MKPKLLLVIDNLEFGGGERVFLQLAAGLRDEFQVFAAAMPGGRFGPELENLGVELLPVTMTRQVSLKPIRRMMEIIRKKGIDIVHSQGGRADFFARTAGYLAKVPHILCTMAVCVEDYRAEPLRRWTYRALDRVTGRCVERFIVVSDTMKQTLMERRNLAPHEIIRIHNGIELDRYRPCTECSGLREEWGIPPDAPLIGTVGRMVWEKGLRYFLEAIPHIACAIPDARFLMVGEGPLRSDLEALSDRLKVADRTVFAGFRSDMDRVLSAVDVLVVPSVADAFPMVVLEGMAMQKPIVATCLRGIMEQIVHGQDGLLVPPGNPQALATAASMLLHDRDTAKRMGISARKRAEEYFSVVRMVQETKDVYRSLL